MKLYLGLPTQITAHRVGVQMASRQPSAIKAMGPTSERYQSGVHVTCFMNMTTFAASYDIGL